MTSDQLIHIYDGLKYWVPLFGGGFAIFRAYRTMKTNVGEWANKLLDNHLSHIESATSSTEIETKRTNSLLEQSTQKATTVADKVDSVAVAVAAHNDKEMQIWSGVVETLAILEDRSRRSRSAVKRKR